MKKEELKSPFDQILKSINPETPEIKDCLFQYATRSSVIEDTDLITRSEAEELWDKYYKEVQKE